MRGNINGILGKDWKLFRAKLPSWQESYMKRLTEEYLEILNNESPSSNKFWTLEKRIREDKRKCGARAEVRRSLLMVNIFSLLNEGAICLNDLDEFSDELKIAAKMHLEYNNQE